MPRTSNTITRFSPALYIAVMALLVASCGTDDAPPPSSNSSEPPATAGKLTDTKDMLAHADKSIDWDNAPGAMLYAENCAMCHEGGVPKAPHRNWIEMMSPKAVLASMTDGIMTEQSAHLSASERRHIAEYLTRQSFATLAEPTPAPRCEGASAEFDMSKPPLPHSWGHDTARFVPAKMGGITRDDLPRMELKWAYAFPNSVRARSQPTIAMGAVFVGSQNGTVYAFDLKTGCVRWTFEASAEVRTAIVATPWEAGAEPPAEPRLYFGDLLARTYALNALTGELIWQTKVDDHPNATQTGTPALDGDDLYVPVSSLEVISAADPEYACCTFRGAVARLDANTGEMIWKTHSIPNPPSEFKKTRIGTPVLGPSGAPFWNSPAIDRERGVLYVGSGENYSSPADDRSNAVFAFDLETGERRWHRQTLANDAWNVACMMADNPNCPEEEGPDLDYAASMILIDQAADDRLARDMLVAGQKTGMIYGLDPDADGAIMWSTRAGRGSTQGGVHFGMAAEGARVYVPIVDMNETYDGRVYTEPDLAGVHAIDAVTGEILWRNITPDVCAGKEYCDPGVSAAITAVPGAVIAGHLDGRLRAYDGETGAVIWTYNTDRPFDSITGLRGHGGSMSGSGPAIGYGHMVVNSGYGLYFHMPGNMLLVFAPANE